MLKTAKTRQYERAYVAVMTEYLILQTFINLLIS